MRKVYLVIKNLVLCGLFFAILISALSFLAPIYRYEEDHISTGNIDTFYAQDKGSVDVVFVGSSAVYRFLVPTVLYKEQGITSVNFSAGGMPAESLSGVISEVVEKQSPKLVVVELRDLIKGANQEVKQDDLTAKESYINRIVNNMPPSLNRAKIIHNYVPSVLNQNEFEWQFEYYKTHYNWKNLDFYDYKEYIKKQLSDKKEIRNVDNSYKGLNYKGACTVSYATYSPTVDNTKNNEIKQIDENSLKNLKDIVQTAKKCGTNVLFLTTPYPEPADYVGYENYVQKYITDEGLSFLNCNKLYKEIGIDFSSDFYDDKHTNTLGATKVTKYIGKYISEKYSLKKTLLNKNQQIEWQTATDSWYKEVYEPGVVKIMDKVNRHKAKGDTNY